VCVLRRNTTTSTPRCMFTQSAQMIIRYGITLSQQFRHESFANKHNIGLISQRNARL